ncbi:hypothetical protein A2U01_0099670, partial [Trifolium medium]|nr:hypothetical protein [Trifolium medium]
MIQKKLHEASQHLFVHDMTISVEMFSEFV